MKSKVILMEGRINGFDEIRTLRVHECEGGYWWDICNMDGEAVTDSRENAVRWKLHPTAGQARSTGLKNLERWVFKTQWVPVYPWPK